MSWKKNKTFSVLRLVMFCKTPSMSIANCVAKIIVETLEPNYSALRKEIERHEFVYMKLNLGKFNPQTGNEFTAPVWGKVLFTCKECAIVQELDMTRELTMHRQATRFSTYKIMFGEEWDTKFVEYIDKDYPRYDSIYSCWTSV